MTLGVVLPGGVDGLWLVGLALTPPFSIPSRISLEGECG